MSHKHLFSNTWKHTWSTTYILLTKVVSNFGSRILQNNEQFSKIWENIIPVIFSSGFSPIWNATVLPPIEKLICHAWFKELLYQENGCVPITYGTFHDPQGLSYPHKKYWTHRSIIQYYTITLNRVMQESIQGDGIVLDNGPMGPIFLVWIGQTLWVLECTVRDWDAAIFLVQ